jgi:hypothetical protein
VGRLLLATGSRRGGKPPVSKNLADRLSTAEHPAPVAE